MSTESQKSPRGVAMPIPTASNPLGQAALVGSCEADSHLTNFLLNSALSPSLGEHAASANFLNSSGTHHYATNFTNNSINTNNKSGYHNLSMNHSNGHGLVGKNGYFADYGTNRVSTFLPLEEIKANDQEALKNETVIFNFFLEN
jgi:hypothetical protein